MGCAKYDPSNTQTSMGSGSGFGINDLLLGGNSSVKVFCLERTYANPVQLVINKEVPVKGTHRKVI